MNQSFSSTGEELYTQAKLNLSRFMLGQAAAWEQSVGFGWRATPDGPSTFSTLKQAFLKSQATGKPLPISDAFSDSTIYISPAVNYAARYVHDLTHLTMDHGFDRDGEIGVALAQLDVLTAFGWGVGTMEYQLLYNDTLGQTLCKTTTGHFPESQRCFIRRAVATSLGSAIRAEQRSPDERELAGKNLSTVITPGNGTTSTI